MGKAKIICYILYFKSGMRFPALMSKFKLVLCQSLKTQIKLAMYNCDFLLLFCLVHKNWKQEYNKKRVLKLSRTVQKTAALKLLQWPQCPAMFLTTLPYKMSPVEVECFCSLKISKCLRVPCSLIIFGF